MASDGYLLAVAARLDRAGVFSTALLDDELRYLRLALSSPANWEHFLNPSIRGQQCRRQCPCNVVAFKVRRILFEQLYIDKHPAAVSVLGANASGPAAQASKNDDDYESDDEEIESMIDRSAHIRAAALTFRTDDIYHTLEDDVEDFENREVVEAFEEELDAEYLREDVSGARDASAAAGGSGEAAQEQASSEAPEKESAPPASVPQDPSGSSSSAFAPIGSSHEEASSGGLAVPSGPPSMPSSSPLPHSMADDEADDIAGRREGGKGKKQNRELQMLLPDVKPSKKRWPGALNTRHEELLTALEAVLNDLKGDPDNAEPFMNKVRKAEAPDYYDIIRDPMYFQLMATKLRKALYHSKDEFERDLELIWANCLKYNPDGSALCRSARVLQERAKMLMTSVPDIDARAHPHSAEAAAASARLASAPSPTPSSPPHGGASGRDVSPLPPHSERLTPARDSDAPHPPPAGAGGQAPSGAQGRANGHPPAWPASAAPEGLLSAPVALRPSSSTARRRAPETPGRPLECLCSSLGCCSGDRSAAAASDAELDELKRDRWRLVTFRQRVRRREYLEAQRMKRFGDREAIPRASDRMQRLAEAAGDPWQVPRVERAVREAEEARRAAAAAAAAERQRQREAKEREAKEREAALHAPTPMEISSGAGAPAEAAKPAAGAEAAAAAAPAAPDAPKAESAEASPTAPAPDSAPAPSPPAPAPAPPAPKPRPRPPEVDPMAAEGAIVSTVRPGVLSGPAHAASLSPASAGCVGFYPELAGPADGLPDLRPLRGLPPRLPPPRDGVLPESQPRYEPLLRPGPVLADLEIAARIREHVHVLDLAASPPDEERPPPPTRPDLARLVAASQRMPPVAAPPLGEAPAAVEAMGAWHMLRQVVALLLSHAGFDAASDSALQTLTDVAAGYLGRLGRSLRVYRDAYHVHASPLETMEAALAAAGEGDTTSAGADRLRPIQSLQSYVQHRLAPQSAKLARVERTLARRAAEVGPVIPEAVRRADAQARAAASRIGDEEEVALMTGSFSAEVDLDFLGLQDMGLPRLPAGALARAVSVPTLSAATASSSTIHPAPAPAAAAAPLAPATPAPPPPPPQAAPGPASAPVTPTAAPLPAPTRPGPPSIVSPDLAPIVIPPAAPPPATPAPPAQAASAPAAAPVTPTPSGFSTPGGRPPGRTASGPLPGASPPAGAPPASAASAPAAAAAAAAAGGHGKRRRGEEAETPAIVVHEAEADHDGADGGDGASSVASRSAPGSPTHESGAGEGDHHELSAPHEGGGRQRRSSRQRKPRAGGDDGDDAPMPGVPSTPSDMATPGGQPGKRKRGRPPGSSKRDS